MEQFIRIFMAIDTNNNNEISTKELIDYAKKNNLSEAIVPRWKTLFDPRNTGIITLNNFLDGLGLKMDEYLVYRKKLNSQYPPVLQLPSDVEKISGDMPIEVQIEIVQQVRKFQPYDKTESLEMKAKQLKKYLDEHHNTTWHVVIVHHSFASAFTHEVGASFTFKMFGLCFVIWKTQEKPQS